MRVLLGRKRELVEPFDSLELALVEGVGAQRAVDPFAVIGCVQIVEDAWVAEDLKRC